MHYLAFPSDYTLAVENMVGLSAINQHAERLGTPGLVLGAVGLIMTAGVAAVALWRSSAGTRRRVAGSALTTLVLAYAYNYGATVTMQLDQTIAWLSWYLSWPLLLAGLAALVWLVVGRAVREPGVAFAVALLMVVGLQYPLEPARAHGPYLVDAPLRARRASAADAGGVARRRGDRGLESPPNFGRGLPRRRASCCCRSSLGRV